MAKFKPGDNVLNLLTNKKGIVCEVLPMARGRQLYRISFEENQIETCLEQNLDLVFDTTNPYELCKKGIYGNRDQFVLLNTTYKINNSNNNTISSLKASKTIFKAYQFKPLLKFLNSQSRRILIADEVGLGKTIEAGHILLELKAREEIKSALIVCPNSLKLKWQTELKEKFGLNFKIYESLNDAVEDLKAHPASARGILNYDKIRIKRNIKNKSENASNCLIEFLKNVNRRYSIVMCDEAHRMRNSETLTYRGMKEILEYTDSVVFLTATPIMLGENDLYNLMHLLDPFFYDNLEVFRNLINANKPFVEAISMLNSNRPLKEIEDHLTNQIINKVHEIADVSYSKEVSVYEEYKDIPLYRQILSILKGKDTLSLRARLQHEIAALSTINNAFSRTRKREISIEEKQQTERKAHKVSIELSEDERLIYDTVINDYIEQKGGYETDMNGEETLPPGSILGLIQKKRMVASCVNGYQLFSESKYDVDTYCKLVMQNEELSDAKVSKLLELFEGVQKAGGEKVIIFTIFKFTVRYLEIKLKHLGIKTFSIHGDIKDREAVILEFKKCKEFCVLLSTEVGSEGLDLQFCSYLVNYDLPWNPMVVEQRIGRIDRFGQKSPSIHIYNLVVKNSIQEIIYDRLLERIGVFRGVIGDLEMILEENGSLLRNLEHDFYCLELTKDELEKKIMDINKALENQKIHVEEIVEGLTNTLTNDVYFQNEISRIRDSKLYVTESELINYIKMLFHLHLPTCSIDQKNENEFVLTTSKSKPKILNNFLTVQQPPGEDYEDLFVGYKKKLLYELEEYGERMLTFKQEHAFDNKEMDYINIYNPLIIAASRYFATQIEKMGRTFQLKLKRPKKCTLPAGLYFVGVYVITSTTMMIRKKIKSNILVPIIYDIANDKTLTDEHINLEIFGLLQDKSEYLSSLNAMPELENEVYSNIESDFTEYITNFVAQKKKENELRNDSLKQLQIKQIEEYFDTRIVKEESNVKEAANLLEWINEENDYMRMNNNLRLARNRLKILEDKKMEAIEKVNSRCCPSISYSLISLTKLLVE